MLIRYMSDLHLEFGEMPPPCGGDLLILAGDITVQRTHWDWVAACGEAFDQVIYIFGNHEHYRKGKKTKDYERLIADAKTHQPERSGEAALPGADDQDVGVDACRSRRPIARGLAQFA